MLAKYCITCHNETRKTAGLMIDKLDLQNVGGDAEVWEKVAGKFRTHEMPPPGAPRPDKATYDAVTAHLERALDAAIAAKPNPGHVPVHRLNRTEYTNAIRDLLAVEDRWRVAVDSGRARQAGLREYRRPAVGFAVAARALPGGREKGQPPGRGRSDDQPDRGDISPFHRVSCRTIESARTFRSGRRAASSIRHLLSSRRRVQHQDSPETSGVLYIMGMGEPHELDVRIDGVRVKRFSVGGEGKG